ncbi:MAG: Eco57I restriction-modification methylase domain-containing protein, partial [Fidelibacterota bacterium]
MSTEIEKIRRLVETFRRNLDAYKASYNETMVRREFIDPFFAALGWDITNQAGYAEAYKEVVHEDAIKIGGATKAPDYAFRIGGVRKFFVEAKKPSVDIKEDIHPAYQLRRYAWSAKLPLSILTDFEEFAVYDCRIKPVITDKASTARVLYLTFEEYAERWEEIESIFSKEAILKGSFDRYVESTRRKRGTAEVDAAFLKEIETWRDVLARNIALRNPQLTQRELNFAISRTIDRIIFLRICEDRGIEDYGQLMALQNGENVYKRLVNRFLRADEKYNSGLFHFHNERNRLEQPDELTLTLAIDDKVLKDIFKRLYYPESPYEFAVLPADILGHIYEQFLGKVIRLTPGHRAKVEEKPEVRKAGGVYYTPTYIVDYIVKNTVGKLLKGKTPRQVSRLKILDPACGSGSFLIGAYQTLLDWHRDWYATHDPQKWAAKKEAPVFHIRSGDWRLTTAKRKEILLNNIYGVDIDPQAVEVTKLSLLLKVLEGENRESINQQMKFFHERALPDLGNNIKCGNSLIGPDFYDGEQISLLDAEERFRINAFDWETEFPEIMKKGGFDAVIGNPPYVRQEMLSKLKNYFHQHYQVYHGTADLYAYFIERGVTLLKAGGKFGYIVANKWLRANYGQPLRRWLKQRRIEKIIDFG